MLGMNVGQLYAQLSMDSKAFEQGLNKAHGDLKGFESKIQATAQKAANLGKTLSMAVTVPLTGLGVVASKASSSFETAITDAAAVAGATGETFQKLSDAAQHFGATTLYSATEAAQGMYYLASAGYEAQQQIDSLGAVLEFAAGTHMGLAEASQLTVSTLNQYGLEATEAGRVTNAFAAAITKSQATAEKLGTSMRYVGALAGTYGNSVEGTTAALMALYNAGLEASQVGTSLRGMFTTLLAPSAAAKNELKRVGVELSDINPKLNSITDIIGELESSGAQLERIFEARTLAGMQILVNEGAEALRKFEKEITGTSKATEIFERQLDTTQGVMGLVKSAAEGVGISFGKHVNDVLRDVADGAVSPLLAKLNGLTDGTKRWIVQMGMVASALPPVIGIMGKLVLLSDMAAIKQATETAVMATNTAGKVANAAATSPLLIATSKYAAGATASAGALGVETAALNANTLAKGASQAATAGLLTTAVRLAKAVAGPMGLVAAFGALTFVLSDAIKKKRDWNALFSTKVDSPFDSNAVSQGELEIKKLQDAISTTKKAIAEMEKGSQAQNIGVVGGMLKDSTSQELERKRRDLDLLNDELLRKQKALSEAQAWEREREKIVSSSDILDVEKAEKARNRTTSASDVNNAVNVAKEAWKKQVIEAEKAMDSMRDSFFRVQKEMADSMSNLGLSAEQAFKAAGSTIKAHLEQALAEMDSAFAREAFLTQLGEFKDTLSSDMKSLLQEAIDGVKGLNTALSEAGNAGASESTILRELKSAADKGLLSKEQLQKQAELMAPQIQQEVVTRVAVEFPNVAKEMQEVIARSQLQSVYGNIGMDVKMPTANIMDTADLSAITDNAKANRENTEALQELSRKIVDMGYLRNEATGSVTALWEGKMSTGDEAVGVVEKIQEALNKISGAIEVHIGNVTVQSVEEAEHLGRQLAAGLAFNPGA